MKAKFLLTLVVAVGFAIPVFANHHVMEACKKECPEAKTEKDANECAEKREAGPGSEEFKKSACHKAHEKGHHKGDKHE